VFFILADIHNGTVDSVPYSQFSHDGNVPMMNNSWWECFPTQIIVNRKAAKQKKIDKRAIPMMNIHVGKNYSCWEKYFE